MNETHEEEVGADEVSVEATFRSSDGGQVVLREVALGMQPIVLIEPLEKDGSLIFSIDATDINREDLVGVLTLLAEAVREGEVTHD